jgi:dTDP-4-amino-4,6-dideoxygalactose transaminase
MIDRDAIKRFVLRRYQSFAPALDIAGQAWGAAVTGCDGYERQNLSLKDEISRELGRVLGARNTFELWSYTKAFEADFAAFCQKPHAVGTSSCTAALQVTLAALGVGPGQEVVTSAHTFVATALAIHNTGATPVLVDPEPGDLCISLRGVEKALTSRTRAIVPVHMHGHVADMGPILDLAEERGIAVVEDCAQAPGASRGGRRVPIGHTGCFSFFANKPIGGAGNGGMIVTDDPELERRLALAVDPEGGDPVVLAGARTPCYLDALEVAVLKPKLARADAWRERRAAIARRYLDAFSGLDAVLPSRNVESAWYGFVLRIANRNRVRSRMLRRGIETRVEYDPPFFRSPAFAKMGWNARSWPVAVRAAQSGLTLPAHPFLTIEEQERVIEAFKNATS